MLDLLGAGIKAQGALQEGQAKLEQNQFQAGIAQKNKQIALQNADYSRKVGEVDAQTSGLKTAQVLGQQKASQGGSGLDVNFGSAVQVRDSTHEIGWHDQQVIRSDSARRAYAFEQEASTQEIQSQMYTRAGANAVQAGNINAASSILGGITSVTDKFAKAAMMGA